MCSPFVATRRLRCADTLATHSCGWQCRNGHGKPVADGDGRQWLRPCPAVGSRSPCPPGGCVLPSLVCSPAPARRYGVYRCGRSETRPAMPEGDRAAHSLPQAPQSGHPAQRGLPSRRTARHGPVAGRSRGPADPSRMSWPCPRGARPTPRRRTTSGVATRPYLRTGRCVVHVADRCWGAGSAAWPVARRPARTAMTSEVPQMSGAGSTRDGPPTRVWRTMPTARAGVPAMPSTRRVSSHANRTAVCRGRTVEVARPNRCVTGRDPQ